MRKISIAGYGYSERLGAEASLSLIKKVGFDAMDYPLYAPERYGDFDLGQGRSDLRRASEIRRAAENEGVVIGQTHAPFGYREGFSEEIILDRYKRAAEATALLGAKYMVVHPLKFNDCIRDHRRQECFDRNIDLFSRFTPTLRETGVTALLENMFVTERGDGWARLLPTIYSSGEELARAKDLLGDAYGVCLDSGHAYITKEDIPAMIRAIGDRLLALHLHDNTGDRDDHLPPYFGKMPLDDLISRLREIGYGGNINFEVRFDAVPISALEAALRYVYDVGVSFRRRLDGE